MRDGSGKVPKTRNDPASAAKYQTTVTKLQRCVNLTLVESLPTGDSDVKRQRSTLVNNEANPTDLNVRVLAIDVGAGTQDILVYDQERTPENAFRAVMPSQTQVVGRRIERATARKAPIHLSGHLMGGGASTTAVQQHIAAGLPVTAESDAARTLHNDPQRVQSIGVQILDEAPPGSEVIVLGDVDLAQIETMLGLFGVEMPPIVAVAVQDHGFRPGSGNNAVRFEYLQSLIDGGGLLSGMLFREAPAEMTRMEAVSATVPGVMLMDTGAAAVLGALADPRVFERAQDDGVILVNVGNMHTFATLIRGRRLFGLFEHHTGGITPAIISILVDRLQAGTLDSATFGRDFDGHGAAIHPDYAEHGPFGFVAVTGPNRQIARSLGYYEAAPHGDMMLTGSFGLVEGVLMNPAWSGIPAGLTLLPVDRSC